MAGGAYVVIALSFGLAGGIVGKIKGSSFFIWFIIATVVPFIGLLAAIVYRSERDELRRQCPTCGRVCKLHDALCMRCGTELEFPEQALASENAALHGPLTSTRSTPATGAGSVHLRRGGRDMRAVDAIMECLKAEGVDVVFGLPGGANLPTYDAFVDAGIRHVLVRHEAGGGHAAEGYAKATGKVGVAFATSGPGATNLVTPIVDAMMDSVPTVFITGQVRTDLLGTDGFQEADTLGITMPVVKHSFMIQLPLEIPRAIHEAFHIARTGRPGPVVVDIPQDLSRADIDYEPVTDLHLPGYQPTTEGNTKQIRQAAKAMASARRPVIYAGGGVINANAVRGALRVRHEPTASRSPAR